VVEARIEIGSKVLRGDLPCMSKMKVIMLPQGNRLLAVRAFIRHVGAMIFDDGSFFENEDNYNVM